METIANPTTDLPVDGSPTNGTATAGTATTGTESAPQPSATSTHTAAPGGRNPWAIASLVLSASSIVLALGIPALLGIVFGVIARRESAHPTDRTLSNWGIGLGIFSLFWWVLLLALGVAVALPLLFLAPWLG